MVKVTINNKNPANKYRFFIFLFTISVFIFTHDIIWSI
ncbi:putative membrane protein, partial [Yersinia pestis PY-03]